MSDLFGDLGSSVLRWDHETLTAQGGGAAARVWRSAVSNKLVVTVTDPLGVETSRQVADMREAMRLADEIVTDFARYKKYLSRYNRRNLKR